MQAAVVPDPPCGHRHGHRQVGGIWVGRGGIGGGRDEQKITTGPADMGLLEMVAGLGVVSAWALVGAANRRIGDIAQMGRCCLGVGWGWDRGRKGREPDHHRPN